jgi:hypothetical protein
VALPHPVRNNRWITLWRIVLLLQLCVCAAALVGLTVSTAIACMCRILTAEVSPQYLCNVIVSLIYLLNGRWARLS